MNKRVLLGMSGGIDSSVSAMLLREQGYDVVGVTFLFGGSEKANELISKEAKLLADKLSIKHHTVDLQKVFRNTVINYFKQEYLTGKTPFPCAFCNPKVKFNYLEKYAKSENCDFIATGHYAQIKSFKEKNYIYQGIDPDKDQSFFLWGLKRNLIDKLIFPLGTFKKTEIKKIAEEKGFVSLSEKKESLGICFIEGNNYREFLEKEGIKSSPGNFVDQNGQVLGQHRGITNFTIGQRRKLGIHLNYPVFVAEIRLDANEIVLAKYVDLYKNKILLKNCHIVDNQINSTIDSLTVKIRYRLQETPCELNILNEASAEVRLLKPEAMIAAGQTAVFYDGERLVGGGFIKSSE